MSKRTEKVAQGIKDHIEEAVTSLNDDDYLEVLDDIESYCNASTEAKREERRRER